MITTYLMVPHSGLIIKIKGYEGYIDEALADIPQQLPVDETAEYLNEQDNINATIIRTPKEAE